MGLCYKCHQTFTPLRLVRQLGGLTLVQAYQLLESLKQGSSGVTVSGLGERVRALLLESGSQPEEEPVPAIPLPEEFIACSDLPQSKWPPYILERIRTAEQVLDYGVGWCDRGYYANRLIVPVVFAHRLVSFVARDYTGTAPRKVLYPKGAKTSKVLFNYDVAKRQRRIIIVEGVFDALAVGVQGVAIFGTHLSSAQVALLANTRAEEILVCLDGDDAGQEATPKVARALRRGCTAVVRELQIPRGSDPSDLPSAWFDRPPSFLDRVRRALP